MRARFVLAPKALLLDPALAASAKTTWLVLRLADSGDRHTTTLVAASTGLSVTTVSRGLAQLSARRWDRPAAPDEATVPIPQDLLTDPEIGVHAKVLYGVLQTFRSHSTRAGQFTYASVAQRSGISLNTVKQGVRELVESRWLKLEQKNQRAPIYFTLTNPERDRAKDEVLQARQRVDRAKHKGEALMREYLSLLIDSSDYEDNAYPVFLTNPLTMERLQLDRYYAPKVGFEFSGPQHYRATGRISQAEAEKQRARDYMKLGMCLTLGITVVVVHPEDLGLEGMRKKVGDLLPLRRLHGRDRLIAYLEAASQGYRVAAMNG